MTLVLIGTAATTTFEGQSPALTVSSGIVIVHDLTFATATDAPTIRWSGGSLTLRNATVRETTGGSQAAVYITGGTLDLGTEASPGGNTLNVNGAGDLIRNTSAGAVSAIGNTFQVDGTTLTSNFRVEDEIKHALDAAGLGLVTWVAGNVFASANKGKVQHGVDLVSVGGIVNVESGVHGEFSAGTRLLTIQFESGERISQQADTLDHTKRALFVWGTSQNDKIKFESGDHGHEVQVKANHLPTGNFRPNGRLIALGAGRR